MTSEESSEIESRRKDRELDLKEREVVVKEKDLARSRWTNPIVIGLFAAALGLLGNFGVAIVNNRNAQKLEHDRAQATLLLEIFKANNANYEAKCDLLTFFVKFKMLDDPQDTIVNECPEPINSPLPGGAFVIFDVRVAGTDVPIQGANIRMARFLDDELYTNTEGIRAVITENLVRTPSPAAGVADRGSRER